MTTTTMTRDLNTAPAQKKIKNTKSKKKELEARMTKVISDYTAQLTERTEHHMG